jgi:hypothetical protein
LAAVRSAEYTLHMYDALTTRYTFSCPVHGEARVLLSSFRRLERLPGTAHPAVYRVEFACGCGGEHPGLVTHDDLDWAPLGLGEHRSFLNLMTSRLDAAAGELGEVNVRRLEGGAWPWSFFCYPEERPRPVFPSSFALLAAEGPRGLVGVAVHCPVCGRVSVNLVSPEHVDLPFHNDAEVGVVEHVFGADAAALVEEFRAELHSASFDVRRLLLG